ncbi:Transcription factor iws1 [Malassezia psittaci]|uniref:Transcription factor iws1 n=1 Tax=Malassezia psittaci TaxID=1821823 RepID=A0AAF0F8B5_9BASI|nr:Transcription factor iws1 [Malassezia psittaci]
MKGDDSDEEGSQAGETQHISDLPDSEQDKLPGIPRKEADESIANLPKKKHTDLSEEEASENEVLPEEAQSESNTMTSKEMIRAQVNAQIDAALKSGKRRTTRRKNAGEDDLELLADEEVSALRTEMIVAADEDEEANRLKQPATAKLRLLPRVVSTLQRQHLHQAIMDNNLLEGVKRWLEPLPDRSLPALNIQKQLFSVLETMSIDTISLKMSGLGRIVVFYSLCERVETQLRRSAEHLIEVWTRPILKRSASYRDRHISQAEWFSNSMSNVSSQMAQQPTSNKAMRSVGIPQAVTTGFQVAPRSHISGSGNDHDNRARIANHQRLNRFKSRLKDANARR